MKKLTGLLLAILLILPYVTIGAWGDGWSSGGSSVTITTTAPTSSGADTTVPSTKAVGTAIEGLGLSTGTDGTYGLSGKNNTSTGAVASGMDWWFGTVANVPSYKIGAGAVTPFGDVLKSSVPWQKDIHVPAPAATDVVRFRTTKVITLSAIGCLVDPADSSESVVVDILECNGDGDSCSTILGATLTCGNTNTTATISDTSLAANAWILIDLGTVTGTVSDLSIYLRGTEAQ